MVPTWNAELNSYAGGYEPKETLLFFKAGRSVTPDALPDYLNDLNAMHEAEKVLPDMASDDDGRDQLGYMETLADTLLAKWSSNNSADMWLITHATAAQRAEALLKALNLWKP